MSCSDQCCRRCQVAFLRLVSSHGWFLFWFASAEQTKRGSLGAGWEEGKILSERADDKTVRCRELETDGCALPAGMEDVELNCAAPITRPPTKSSRLSPLSAVGHRWDQSTPASANLNLRGICTFSGARFLCPTLVEIRHAFLPSDWLYIIPTTLTSQGLADSIARLTLRRELLPRLASSRLSVCLSRETVQSWQVAVYESGASFGSACRYRRLRRRHRQEFGEANLFSMSLHDESIFPYSFKTCDLDSRRKLDDLNQFTQVKPWRHSLWT